MQIRATTAIITSAAYEMEKEIILQADADAQAAIVFEDERLPLRNTLREKQKLRMMRRKRCGKFLRPCTRRDPTLRAIAVNSIYEFNWDEDKYFCRISYDLHDDFAHHPSIAKLSPQQFATPTMRVMERWQLTKSSSVGDDPVPIVRRWTLSATHIMLHIPSEEQCSQHCWSHSLGLTNRKESV